jgi:TetR/AcrR family transcriptional regulator, transcriptional repressor for nem operon
MRYEKGHKDATRKHILDVASRRFRKDGIAATGLACIMKDAGLTNGAFYAHFSSKAALVEEVVITSLENFNDEFVSRFGEKGSRLREFIRVYLGTDHRDNPKRGCPTSALVAEIGRAPRPIKKAYTNSIEVFFRLLSEAMDSTDPALARQQGIALFALAVGSLQLARAVTDKHLSEEIMQAGIEVAIKLMA